MAATTAADPWAGVQIAQDIEQIADGVRSKSWVEASLGVSSGGLDGLAVASDPVGALLQYGIAWLIEHVKPLSEPLDRLAGNPGQIAAQARSWRAVAAGLSEDADDLQHAVQTDVAAWTGSAATSYRAWAVRQESVTRSLARAAETMALMVEGAGAIIGGVRQLIRDGVATVVARLISYAGELIATAGAATPVVAEQVETLCDAWAVKISNWLRDLMSSLRRLQGVARALGDRITQLARMRDGDDAEPALASAEPSDTSSDGVASVDGSPPGVGDEPVVTIASNSGSGTTGSGGDGGPANSPSGGGDPVAAADAEHLRALGTDPAVGRYRADEAQTAQRVEQQLGIHLSRSPDGKVDWIGPDGETYDAVGNFDGSRFDQQWSNLQTRITDHAAKADRVPVDVSRFTPEQRQQVRDFINSSGLGGKVFMVGD